MQSIKVWRPWPLMASMVIMMITFGAFISGCDTEDQGSGSSEVEADRPVERFEFESGEQLEQLINRLNYTPEAWQAGIREVPRLYITNFPKRWRDRTSKEIPWRPKSGFSFGFWAH
jgi:hypothetical protein